MVRHVILGGETSGSIARRYNVTRQALFDANPQLVKVRDRFGNVDFAGEHFRRGGVINVPAGTMAAPALHAAPRVTSQSVTASAYQGPSWDTRAPNSAFETYAGHYAVLIYGRVSSWGMGGLAPDQAIANIGSWLRGAFATPWAMFAWVRQQAGNVAADPVIPGAPEDKAVAYYVGHLYVGPTKGLPGSVGAVPAGALGCCGGGSISPQAWQNVLSAPEPFVGLSGPAAMRLLPAVRRANAGGNAAVAGATNLVGWQASMAPLWPGSYEAYWLQRIEGFIRAIAASVPTEPDQVVRQQRAAHLLTNPYLPNILRNWLHYRWSSPVLMISALAPCQPYPDCLWPSTQDSLPGYWFAHRGDARIALLAAYAGLGENFRIPAGQAQPGGAIG